MSFISCSEDDEPTKEDVPVEKESPKINKAPGAFEVSVNAEEVISNVIESPKSSRTGAKSKEYKYVVTWTEAVDPEGDDVTYSVEIDGVKIASDITDRTATIYESDLVSGNDQTVIVDAKDSKDAINTVSKDFTKSIYHNP